MKAEAARLDVSPPRALLVAVLLLVGCDPADRITLTVAAPAGDSVVVYFVYSADGQTTWDELAGRGRATDAGLIVTSRTCCGTASAYRSGHLWFFACAERPDAPPTLICGKVGSASPRVTHAASPGETCSAIERSLAHLSLDVATCTLTPR